MAEKLPLTVTELVRTFNNLHISISIEHLWIRKFIILTKSTMTICLWLRVSYITTTESQPLLSQEPKQTFYGLKNYLQLNFYQTGHQQHIAWPSFFVTCVGWTIWQGNPAFLSSVRNVNPTYLHSPYLERPLQIQSKLHKKSVFLPVLHLVWLI